MYFLSFLGIYFIPIHAGVHVHTYVGVPTKARKGGPEPLKLDLQVFVLGTQLWSLERAASALRRGAMSTVAPVEVFNLTFSFYGSYFSALCSNTSQTMQQW